MEEYRSNKTTEMEMIHSRMKGIIAKRDATIRQLRSELQETQVQLSKLQGIVQQRSKELVMGPLSPGQRGVLGSPISGAVPGTSSPGQWGRITSPNRRNMAG